MTDSASHRPSPKRRTLFGRVLQRRPLVAFLAITVIWSWGYWLSLGAMFDPDVITFLHTMPGLWGPAVAALTVTWASGERVREWLASVGTLRPGVRWYMLAVGGFVLVPELGRLGAAAIVGSPIQVNAPGALLVAFFVALFVGGALEEIGLRGFAHPRLRRRYGTLVAGLLIGMSWAVWHLPLQHLGVGFSGSFPLFLAALIPISIVLGWLYDAAGGSVPVAMVAHAALDTPGLFELTAPDSPERAAQLATLVVYWLIVVAIAGHALWADDARMASSSAETDRGL